MTKFVTQQLPDAIYGSQKNYYAVNKNGSDTNSGLSDDDALLTIGRAVTLINALTGGDVPSATNPYSIHVIGGGEFQAGVGLPSYVHLYMNEATFSGSLYMKADSSVHMNTITDAFATGDAQIVFESGGTGTGNASVFIEGDVLPSTSGFLANESGDKLLTVFVSGRILANNVTNQIFKSTSPTGDYLIYAQEIVTDLVNGMMRVAPSGAYFNLDLIANKIINTSASASSLLFDIDGASAPVNINVTANRIISEHGKIYNAIGSQTKLKINCPDYREAVVSTQSTGAHVDIKTARSQSFVNLSTTPVSTFTFEKDTVYLVNVKATDSRSNNFMLCSSYNSGLAEIVFTVFNPNNGAVTQSPAFTFNIAVTGYATASFKLIINNQTGAASFEASSATTGTTVLSICQLTSFN